MRPISARWASSAALVALLITTARPFADSTPANPAAPRSGTTGGVVTSTLSVVGLLADGIAYSSTFAAIITDLQFSDVLVTLEPAFDLKHGVNGCTTFVARTPIRRYLRVRFDPRGSRVDQIAVIGHELWHACEIARHPEVTTPGDFRALYASGILGHPVRWQWDSEGAVAAGQRISSELVAASLRARR